MSCQSNWFGIGFLAYMIKMFLRRKTSHNIVKRYRAANFLKGPPIYRQEKSQYEQLTWSVVSPPSLQITPRSDTSLTWIVRLWAAGWGPPDSYRLPFKWRQVTWLWFILQFFKKVKRCSTGFTHRFIEVPGGHHPVSMMNSSSQVQWGEWFPKIGVPPNRPS